MDILQRITILRKERNWSEYQLAQKSDLPQSTISSWYRKNMLPSISSLEKICYAFGLSLAQFFSENDSIVSKKAEMELLHEWNRLESEQQKYLLNFLKSL